jgi:hypothetical protein
MGPTQHTECPFDWADGSETNDKLTFGTTLAAGRFLFAHFYSNTDGSVKSGLLATKAHYPSWKPLPIEWMEEYNQLSPRLIKLVGTPARNISRNLGSEEDSGYTAGVRVPNHWHEHYVPRFPGAPSSNMGLGLMITQFDNLVYGLETLARTCDPQTAERIRQLIGKARVT